MAKTRKVSGSRSTSIAGSDQLSVGGDKTTDVRGSRTTTVAGSDDLTASEIVIDCSGGRTVVVAGGDQVIADTIWREAGSVRIKADKIELVAPVVECSELLRVKGMLDVSGIVHCEVLDTQTVVSASYSSGAGNIL